ncbi:MAG: MFS transporter, partial [Opitutae bacterium]|nr:MFS transporter [Opitutae bacterium]
MSSEKPLSIDNPEGRARKFNPSYSYYALGVLTVAYICNFVDRQILAILQESIKAELGLMDWQLGLLSGIAFAIFYVSVGIP